MAESQILGLFTTRRDAQRMAEDEAMQRGLQFDRNIPGAMAAERLSVPRGAGMFDPRVQEAAKIEEIRKSVPFDVENQSEYYTTLAQQLINQGLTRAGAQALEMAKKSRLDEAKIRKQEATEVGDLSVTAEKEINKSNEAYSDAISNFSKAAELSAKFLDRQDDLTSGIASALGETWKDIVGGQDEVTALRKQALGLFNSAALKSLPPGPASDTDVALARQPFPDANADPVYIANFLAGQAKGQLLDAEFNKFRASYLSQNRGDAGGLIPAWQEYYRGLDLAQLFEQNGFAYKPQGQVQSATPATSAAGTTDWSSL